MKGKPESGAWAWHRAGAWVEIVGIPYQSLGGVVVWVWLPGVDGKGSYARATPWNLIHRTPDAKALLSQRGTR